MADISSYEKIAHMVKNDNQSTRDPSPASDGNSTSDDDKSIKGLSVKTRNGRAIVSFDLKNDMSNILSNLSDPVNKNLLETLKKKPKTEEEKRLHKLQKKRQWYAEHREAIRQKIRDQYHNDHDIWLKIRERARVSYQKSREGVENQKRGRKPKEIDPDASPKTPRPRGRPPVFKQNIDIDNAPKNPIGRPKLVSF